MFPQSWNRYAYAFNNTLLFIDPTGLVPGDFYNQDLSKIGTDGKNDGKIYVVTNDAEIKQIKANDKNGGTTQLSAVSSAIELPSYDVRQAIGDAVNRSNSPTATDTTGKFHEEGLIWGKTASGQEKVVVAAPGAYSDPTIPGNTATIDVFKPANKVYRSLTPLSRK